MAPLLLIPQQLLPDRQYMARSCGSWSSPPCGEISERLRRWPRLRISR